MYEFFQVLFTLVFTHMIADYPLQGEFLAKAKNRSCPLEGTPWYHGLIAHGVIHGGFVGIVTGSVLLGILETVAHAIIDDCKCAKKLTYNQDQLLHLLCKILWAAIYVF